MSNNFSQQKQIVSIGIMLFALFFGAGNLVFPANLGQLAGNHVWVASLGFCLTGVILPLLGVIALSFSGEKDFLQLSQRAGKLFGLVFTTTLYLLIGPLFAMPRTGAVSYEIAIEPFFGSKSSTMILFIFSVFYFLITCLCSLNPYKIVNIVGKVLTPIMLILIVALIVFSVVWPMGEIQSATDVAYEKFPFFVGFREGFLTMDALASFIFGIIVINNIQLLGITSHKGVLSSNIKASLIAAFLLAFIYFSLGYIGAMSVEKLGVLKKGSAVLSNVTDYYFGSSGKIILAVIVLMACLTTSIGLTVSCATYVKQLFPKISYKFFAILFCVISAGFATFGLNKLISISFPVLVVVYPLTIAFIILTFTHKLFKGRRGVYLGCFAMVFCISIFDGINAIESEVIKAHMSKINQLFADYLPLSHLGLGWLLPGIIGGIAGYIIDRK